VIFQRFDAELITSNINHIHGSTNSVLVVTTTTTTTTRGTTNFLDLLLTGKEPMNKDEIHHKPIYADTTTNFFSNHPTKQNSCIQVFYYMHAFIPTLTGTKRMKHNTTYIAG